MINDYKQRSTSLILPSVLLLMVSATIIVEILRMTVRLRAIAFFAPTCSRHCSLHSRECLLGMVLFDSDGRRDNSHSHSCHGNADYGTSSHHTSTTDLLLILSSRLDVGRTKVIGGSTTSRDGEMVWVVMAGPPCWGQCNSWTWTSSCYCPISMIFDYW